MSAFGGIVALNRSLDKQTAEAVTDIFTEVVIAPDASDAAKAIMAAKPNLRLLLTGSLPDPIDSFTEIKSIAGGFLMQSRDGGVIEPDDLRGDGTDAYRRRDTDMMFALRSPNTSSRMPLSSSRMAARQAMADEPPIQPIAAQKARDMAAHHGWPASRTIGSVVASDAFFPFADGLALTRLVSAGQPGGSA